VTVTINANTDLGGLLVATNKEKPKRADLDRLHEYLLEHPEESEKVGNLARHVQVSILGHAFQKAQGVEMVVATHCKELRVHLEYEQSTLLERLLIDHIVICWLRLYDCELRYESVRKDNPTITQMQHWEKRLSAAQRRFLRASEALVRVRRLLKDPPSPALAILLKQQLNVGR
jgi:hypothetical protein